MNCDCIAQVNQLYADQNLALNTVFTLGKNLSLSGSSLGIGTHWKDESKKVRGKKPPTILVAFCPFCGKKAEGDSRKVKK